MAELVDAIDSKCALLFEETVDFRAFSAILLDYTDACIGYTVLLPRTSKMSGSNSLINDAKIEVLDGKLHIFRRPDTRYWWCGFHLKGNYIRASTKCSDLNLAIEAAKQWYYRKQGAIDAGVPIVPKNLTFNHFAKLALDDYEQMVTAGQRSSSYVRGLRVLLKNDLGKFFGSYPLTAINQQLWHKYMQQRLVPSNAKPSTVHTHLNGIRIVFRRAKLRGELQDTPVFLTERKTASDATPRTWFEPEQYDALYTATRANITKLKGTRWHSSAMELHDYVLFMANTGLRIGEAKNMRFCDIERSEDTHRSGTRQPILIIKNIKGKRGTGSCKTFFGAVRPFERIIERRGFTDTWKTSTEKVFEHHHRDMFNTVLERINLKFTSDQPPRRRDLMSLRHTYICFRLMDGVGIWDIAANCRTSVSMIEQHYARWLNPLLANINAGPLRRFGAEDTETAGKKPRRKVKSSPQSPDASAPNEAMLEKIPIETESKQVASTPDSG